MAESEVLAPVFTDFGFTAIRLIKKAVLGSGSYGTVYKASCDDLTCAAKVLHHQNSREFMRECEFLSHIRHPNIVLFLGLSQDPDTNFPMLLMELMDENLTQFLENICEPLSFHTEVNICNDVALALSFLHSNGIIHRNLSSNNILMLGDRQAKVTDFGMVKLWTSINQGVPLINPPDCNVYMPPDTDTSHSSKLDVFSFGVLAIQIITGFLPQPTDPFLTVGGNLKLQNLKVPEIERRKNHITLIPSEHQILPLIMNCIRDKEINRPSSSDLCSRLVDIKKSAAYLESGTNHKTSTTDIILDDIDKLVRDMQYFPPSSEGGSVSHRSTSRGDSVEPFDLRSMEGQLSSAEQTAASEEIRHLRGELDKALQVLKEKDNQLESLTAKLIGSEANRETLQSVSHHNTAGISEGTAEKVEEQSLQTATYRDKVDRLTKEVENSSQQLKEKDRVLQMTEQQCSELKEALQSLEKKFAMRERASSSAPLNRVTLEWKREIKSPLLVSRSTEAMVISGSVIFIRPAGTKDVHAYNIETDSWSKFPDAPMKNCSLTLIKRNLTVIGGEADANQFTNKVICLIRSGDTKKWVEIYPPMAVKRSNVITVHCQTALIVAGGENHLGYVKTVEVLDTSSAEGVIWSRVADLPDPLAMASATLCEGYFYLLGGWIEKMSPTQSVYSVSVDSLLQSHSSDTPWTKITSLQIKGSSCVSVKGRLLAVGGRDIHRPTNAVHIYNPVSESWEVLSHMMQPRHQCFAGVVEDKLVVVGGWVLTKKQLLTETKTIEVAAIL